MFRADLVRHAISQVIPSACIYIHLSACEYLQRKTGTDMCKIKTICLIE